MAGFFSGIILNETSYMGEHFHFFYFPCIPALFRLKLIVPW